MATAQELTEVFYAWERRGRGWWAWPDPVELEPPFRPLLVAQLGPEPVPTDDGHRSTLLSRLTEQLLQTIVARSSPLSGESDEWEEPCPKAWAGLVDAVELRLAVPPDLAVSRDLAEHFLLALPMGAEPIAFELLGTNHRVSLSIACTPQDEPGVFRALKAHFPDVVISRQTGALRGAWEEGDPAETVLADLGLAHEFMVPLRIPRSFEVDPLAGIVATLGDAGPGEAAVLQVLLQRTRHPWARESLRSVLDDQGSPFFIDAPEISSLAKAKVRRPLLACVVRVGARAAARSRAMALTRRLTGTLRVLDDPMANELIPLSCPTDTSEEHAEDLLLRRTHRSGMLLSVEEVASLVHLPSRTVRDPRLLRRLQKTKAAPHTVHGAGVALGINEHDGETREVRLTVEQRMRHLHVIGASGTGKSTLILNLVLQDLQAGAGLALLDPHGDLVDRVIGLIPEQRLEDVILLDPADTEHPIGFNILSSASDLEKTLLSSDLVTVFQRLSTSWGDQMTSVLGNALLAFLESDRGGTLLDLRRFLVEDGFRRDFLPSVQDPDVVYFWRREFPLLRGRPQAPILTRLDAFLRPKAIRYMAAQRESRLDLRRVMDEGKVLLCRLSHGAIGEENAHLLGSLLVSKLQQMAMSRQDTAEADRRPFYLYVDEFHHFITPSMAQILSGTRKYGLGLVLAHQDLRQLQSRSADVASSVLSNPATRVAFRVGDEDARVLAKGFAGFDEEDLQNLSIGEAIARIERADHDFNLRTLPLPDVESGLAQERRKRVVEQSRQRYARPRAEVEALLAAGREEAGADFEGQPRPSRLRTDGPQAPANGAGPPVAPSTHAVSPLTPVPASLSPTEGSVEALTPTVAGQTGRGGPQHLYLQELVRQWGEANGWGVVVEEGILGGAGSVDVALRKSGAAIACEIVVSTPPEHEAAKLSRCLEAGFLAVVVVSSEQRKLARVRALAKERLGEEDFARIHFVSPEALFELLSGFAPEKESTVRGYRVRVRVSPEQSQGEERRRGAVSAVIGSALRRLKRSAAKRGT